MAVKQKETNINNATRIGAKCGEWLAVLGKKPLMKIDHSDELPGQT